MDAENAEAVRRFRELARVQARGGLEFLSAQERAPRRLPVELLLALVIVLLMVTYFYIKVNQRLRARVTFLEDRLEMLSIAKKG